MPFEIPKSWVWVRFAEVTNNHDGQRRPIKSTDRSTRQGQYPYYGASGIIDYFDSYIFDGEYLLISEDGANLLARTTPIAFIAKGKFWVNNHAHIVKAKEVTSHEFIENYFAILNISRWVTGAAQPKFNQEKLNSVPIPLPPIAEQKRIVSVVQKQQAVCQSLEQDVERLRVQAKKLRESILASAFSGKLVPQDPSEGTGHELLEQIRAATTTVPDSEDVTDEAPKKPRKKRTKK